MNSRPIAPNQGLKHAWAEWTAIRIITVASAVAPPLANSPGDNMNIASSAAPSGARPLGPRSCGGSHGEAP
jgi:hypothetical protein